MARTTVAAVRVILGDHIEITDTNLDVHIDTASLLVDAEFVGSALNDALLTDIEKYLAAHLAALADLPPGVDEQTIDRDEEVFSKAKGLERTHYGQVAITLDVTGTLGKSGRPASTLMVL